MNLFTDANVRWPHRQLLHPNWHPVEVQLNWFNFFPKIQQVCPFKEDKTINELHSLLETDNLKDDTKIIIQVLLLPHLVPPKGRIRLKQEYYKSSISECENSIVLYAKIHGDISRIQDEKVKRAQRLGLSIQPVYNSCWSYSFRSRWILCVIDTILYQVSTALATVDLCFKIFYVFDVNYPPESKHICCIMQLCLYKFSTK